MRKILFLVLFLVLNCAAEPNNTSEKERFRDDAEEPVPNGRSFFLFGAIFRRFRRKLLGYNDPAPLYAGPAYPLYGYYNCPAYGCSPAVNYRPEAYENINYYNYAVNPPVQALPNPPPPLPPPLPPVPAVNPFNGPFALPQQQQQQTQQAAQQQSNVVIYQRGSEQPGYYAQNVLPAAPLPLPPRAAPPPPPPPLPPPQLPLPYGANMPPPYAVNNFANYPPTGPAMNAPIAPAYGGPGPAYGAPPPLPVPAVGACNPQAYSCGLGR